jgi:sec-independent protein translocase protein TatA
MSEYLQVVGFWSPGPVEIVVILVVALLLFGRRLPEIARNIGKSLTEFKKGINEAKETQDEVTSEFNKVTNDIKKEVRESSGLDDLDKD